MDPSIGVAGLVADDATYQEMVHTVSFVTPPSQSPPEVPSSVMAGSVHEPIEQYWGMPLPPPPSPPHTSFTAQQHARSGVGIAQQVQGVHENDLDLQAEMDARFDVETSDDDDDAHVGADSRKVHVGAATRDTSTSDEVISHTPDGLAPAAADDSQRQATSEIGHAGANEAESHAEDGNQEASPVPEAVALQAAQDDGLAPGSHTYENSTPEAILADVLATTRDQCEVIIAAADTVPKGLDCLRCLCWHNNTQLAQRFSMNVNNASQARRAATSRLADMLNIPRDEVKSLIDERRSENRED